VGMLTTTTALWIGHSDGALIRQGGNAGANTLDLFMGFCIQPAQEIGDCTVACSGARRNMYSVMRIWQEPELER